MAAGDIKIAYGSSSALTQTALDSLATSATWVTCWSSAAVDNSSTGTFYSDYLISGKIVAGASPATSWQIRAGIVAEQSDSTWPSTFDGSQQELTITTTSHRDQIVKLGAVISCDNTASATYPFEFSVAALFGGLCPRKFVVYVAQSSGQDLASSGNLVYVKGIYHTVAQA